MYNKCSDCGSTGGRHYMCDACYTVDRVMYKNMVTWLLEHMQLGEDELPRDIRQFVLSKGCSHPGNSDEDCPHNYPWTCDHCPIVEQMNEPQQSPTFLGKTFDPYKMNRFYRLMSERDGIHNGQYILTCMMTNEIPTEGCGVREDKQYKVHCLQDSLTFEEI